MYLLVCLFVRMFACGVYICSNVMYHCMCVHCGLLVCLFVCLFVVYIPMNMSYTMRCTMDTYILICCCCCCFCCFVVVVTDSNIT